MHELRQKRGANDMKNDVVELRVHEGIAWLGLNRPQSLNALNLASIEQFAAHVRSLKRRRDVRVVVTRGSGRAFCAGSDIRELAGMSRSQAVAAERRHGQVFAQLKDLPQPTIAMLHGYVLGGGLGAALYHDFRITASDAVLGFPEVELGWTPPWGLGRLVQVAGHASASWLLLTGERVSGTRAAALGLVNETVPPADLETRTQALAEGLQKMPAHALARTKRLLSAMSAFPDHRWDEKANEAFRFCLAQPSAQHALTAFARRSGKGA